VDHFKGGRPDYLLPPATFAASRAEGRLDLALPDAAEAWLEARGGVLREKLKAVLAAAAVGSLVDASLTEAGLKVTPIRREQRDRAKVLSRRLYTLVPRIRITDLLAEVNGWTSFTGRFTHFRAGEATADLPALMGAILADATNLGLDRMAESSRGLTIHQLNLVIDRYIRPETYAAALAAVVDAQPFAAVWGPGSTSSSDGQFSLPVVAARRRRTTTRARAPSRARCSTASSRTASPPTTRASSPPRPARRPTCSTG
jgi:hypothetical protein